MTRDDLSPVMQQAYDALATDEQKRELLENHYDMLCQMKKGAIARVYARNFSHNVGVHLSKIN